MRIVTLVLVAAAAASTVLAYQDDYHHGRIRYLEPGVALQRASESSAEEAAPNLPFLPGDRLWTDGSGRVELQFADGSVLSLDIRTKLDYVDHAEGRSDRIVLRLWSGSAFLRTRDGGFADFEVETPAALVATRARGSFRIDADAGETRLTVFEGTADLEAARRRVVVEAGERSWVTRGGFPESPRRFDRWGGDDFDRWNEERDERAYARGSTGYLPDEIDPYASELESHGSWYFVAEVGHVWRPYVAAGWQPYTDGRWVWTHYGWTWVPSEPWGWAPFHYGRWGYSGAVGWYWIPDGAWGPAWVSWAVGGDYVGWCPLGYRDRPVDATFERGSPGHGIPRDSAAGPTTAWVYAKRGDVSAPDLAKRRVAAPRPEVTRDIRVIDSSRARPTRDFRVVDVETPERREGAVPRNVKMKPTPGDTIPELRGDNQTTIPAPILRRPRPEAEDARSDRGTTTHETAPPAPRADAVERGETVHRREMGESPRTRDEAKPARTEPDRDVLRRLFRPLSEPRAAEPRTEPRTNQPRTAAPRSEPHSVPTQRAEPQRTAPSSPPTTERHAPRPPKDKDNR